MYDVCCKLQFAIGLSFIQDVKKSKIFKIWFGSLWQYHSVFLGLFWGCWVLIDSIYVKITNSYIILKPAVDYSTTSNKVRFKDKRNLMQDLKDVLYEDSKIES